MIEFIVEVCVGKRVGTGYTAQSHWRKKVQWPVLPRAGELLSEKDWDSMVVEYVEHDIKKSEIVVNLNDIVCDNEIHLQKMHENLQKAGWKRNQ